MADSAVKFGISDIIRDFLFVEESDFYPDEIWEDFAEAFELFLTDDEIEVLNYRYGSDDFCRFSVDKRRRILSDLMLRFNRSELFNEMDSTMKNCEREIFSDYQDDGPVNASGVSDGFVRNSLLRLGLEYTPASLGDLDFDSQIGDFPVYVWRSSNVEMPVRALKQMLRNAEDEGFGHFFIVAQPRLIVDLPNSIDGCIPYTFLPLIDQSVDTGETKANDSLFTM
ncbi:MAG: hypothetical protein R2681_04620 [Pyrinomonadaceae bacterium]